MSDPSARNITVSVKVNRLEAAILKAYGRGQTPGRGLRRLIDRHLPEPVYVKTRKREEEQ